MHYVPTLEAQPGERRRRTAPTGRPRRPPGAAGPGPEERLPRLRFAPGQPDRKSCPRRGRPPAPVCFHRNSAPETQEFWPRTPPNSARHRHADTTILAAFSNTTGILAESRNTAALSPTAELKQAGYSRDVTRTGRHAREAHPAKPARTAGPVRRSETGRQPRRPYASKGTCHLKRKRKPQPGCPSNAARRGLRGSQPGMRRSERRPERTHQESEPAACSAWSADARPLP